MYPDTIINTPFGSPISSRRAGVTQGGLSQGRVIPNGMVPASLFGVEKASIHLLMMFVHAVSASHRRRELIGTHPFKRIKSNSRLFSGFRWFVWEGLHCSKPRSHYLFPVLRSYLHSSYLLFSDCFFRMCALNTTFFLWTQWNNVHGPRIIFSRHKGPA